MALFLFQANNPSLNEIVLQNDKQTTHRNQVWSSSKCASIAIFCHGGLLKIVFEDASTKMLIWDMNKRLSKIKTLCTSGRGRVLGSLYRLLAHDLYLRIIPAHPVWMGMMNKLPPSPTPSCTILKQSWESSWRFTALALATTTPGQAVGPLETPSHRNSPLISSTSMVMMVIVVT